MTTIYIESGILNTIQVRYLYSICVLNFADAIESTDSDFDYSSEDSIESSDTTEYSSLDISGNKQMKRFEIDTTYYKDGHLKDILASLSCDVTILSSNVDVFIYLIGIVIDKCYVGESRLLTTNRRSDITKMKSVSFEFPKLVLRTKKHHKQLEYPGRVNSLSIYHCGEFQDLERFLVDMLKQSIINKLSITWTREFTDEQAKCILNTIQGSHVKQLDIVITNRDISCEQLLNRIMTAASFSNLLHVDVHVEFDKELQLIIDRFLPICVINNNQTIGYKNKRDIILRKVCIMHSMYQGLTLRALSIDILRLLFEYM